MPEQRYVQRVVEVDPGRPVVAGASQPGPSQSGAQRESLIAGVRPPLRFVGVAGRKVARRLRFLRPVRPLRAPAAEGVAAEVEEKHHHRQLDREPAEPRARASTPSAEAEELHSAGPARGVVVVRVLVVLGGIGGSAGEQGRRAVEGRRGDWGRGEGAESRGPPPPGGLGEERIVGVGRETGVG